jgi:hypothetical protein
MTTWPRACVQETGRCSGADGPIVTGTPDPIRPAALVITMTGTRVSLPEAAEPTTYAITQATADICLPGGWIKVPGAGLTAGTSMDDMPVRVIGLNPMGSTRRSITLPRMNTHRLVIAAAALTTVVAAALATALAVFSSQALPRAVHHNLSHASGTALAINGSVGVGQAAQYTAILRT